MLYRVKIKKIRPDKDETYIGHTHDLPALGKRFEMTVPVMDGDLHYFSTGILHKIRIKAIPFLLMGQEVYRIWTKNCIYDVTVLGVPLT